MAIDKIPPQCQDAEEAVIGTILCYPGNISKVMSILTPDMFYLPDLQIIYKCCIDLFDRGETLDLITVTNELSKKGFSDKAVYLTALTGKVITDQMIINHALLVKEKYILRKYIQLGNDLINLAHYEDLSVVSEKAEEALQNISSSFDNNKKLNPAKAADKFRINFLNPQEEPPAVIFTKNDGKLTASFTLQNFSLIIGKAKTKKTYLTILIVSVYLGHNIEIFQRDTKRKGTVLYFDTEQSPFHLHRMLNRMCIMIGDPNPDNLMAFSLKTMTPEERIKFIDYMIKNTPGVRMVVVDGIRDLVYDINSPEESTKIQVQLMKWATESDLHIINVLHTNKGDSNARGHLGSELTNKAEIVLSITREGDRLTTTVEPEYCRDMEFKPFSFLINDNGFPELCEMPGIEPGKTRTEPNLIPSETHRKVLEEIFKNQHNIKYKEICIGIKLGFADAGIYFGENKARDYLAYYIKEGWVSKNEINKCYKYERAIF